MVAGCVDRIDSLDDLVDALGHLERFGAFVAVAAAGLGTAGVWSGDGSLSMAAWLRQHARLSHRDASRLLREGRFLSSFDAVGDAAQSGALSASQVAGLRAVVSRPTGELFAEHQHGVVEAICGLNAADSELVCQDWRAKAEAVVEMPEPKIQERSWSMARLEDGTMSGRFVLDATAAEMLETALQTARSWDGANDTRTVGVRNADAFVGIVGFFNANSDTDATPRHHPQIELHIQADGSDVLLEGCAVTANGRLLPSWAADAFMCDCVVHRVLRDGAAILDYGRGVRTVPAALWRAVAARDRGCRFPGCTRQKAWCDAHHILWWRNHGDTKLDNLLLLCNRHHHLIHRQRWDVQLLPSAEARFIKPDGTMFVSQPRGRPNIRDPITA